MIGIENPSIALSIITPVRNKRAFIGGCIENVARQGVEGMEHIVMDGASTDGTRDVLMECSKRFPHLRVVSEPDQGQSDAMNKALRLARGAIIGTLNADDYYEPQALPYVVQAFKSFRKPTFLVGNCKVWDSAGQLSFESAPSRMSFRSMLRKPTAFNFPVNPSAYFYHRSLHERIGYYDIHEDLALDMDLVLRLLRVADVQYVDRLLGNFRLLEDTKTHQAIQSGIIPARTQEVLKRQWERLPLLERIQLRWAFAVDDWRGVNADG